MIIVWYTLKSSQYYTNRLSSTLYYIISAGGGVEISTITRDLKPQCVLTPLPPGKKILFTLPGQIPIYPITGNQIGVSLIYKLNK